MNSTRYTARGVGIAAGVSLIYALIWTALAWPRSGAKSIVLGGAIWLAAFFIGIIGLAMWSYRARVSATSVERISGRRTLPFVAIGLVLAVAVSAIVFLIGR